MEWSEVISRQLQVASAGIGACGTVAMGAIGFASTDISAADTPEPAPPGPVTTSEITTGATVTDSVGENGPKTSIAVPPMTTTPSENPPTAVQH
jgi:hypothetical protein